MINLRVTRVGKEGNGNISSLCGSWGKVGKTAAVRLIKCSDVCFYVESPSGAGETVKVVERNGREYLETSHNRQKENGLAGLPPCGQD